MSTFSKYELIFVGLSCVFFCVMIVTLSQISSYDSVPKPIGSIRTETLPQTKDDIFTAYQTTSDPSSDNWIKSVEKELPNIPFDFWMRIIDQPHTSHTNCTEYPSVFKLNFHNTYWQTYENENTTFQLYSAYYDKRSSAVNGPVVRILAMLNQSRVTDIPKNYCQLWYDNSTIPSLVSINEYHSIYPTYWDLLPGYLYPYLITCLPQPSTDKRVPLTVSLVKSNCETAKNNLRIWHEEPTHEEPKRKFAVCLKGLDFPYTDNSIHLVEWFELLRILGASKVVTYHLATHPNATKVLNYYQKTGFIDVHPLSLAGGEPPVPYYQHKFLEIDQMAKRLNEFIPFNDCLYRNMYKYDYLAAIDIDEIIMPLEPHTNWQELIETAKDIQRTNYNHCDTGFASICFLNTYFPKVVQEQSVDKTIPDQMYMLLRILRVPEHSDVNHATKCIHNTSHVHTLHNHFPLTWQNSCRPITLEEDVAQLQHYRNPSEEKFRQLSENLLADNNIWRFKEELLIKSEKVLKELGFHKK